MARSKLEAGLRNANATLQAAGQAAWARILSSYTGELAVTFGVILSGRTTENAADVAFPCITTVPVGCQVDRSNKVLLDRMMESNLAIQRHQFTPLPKIQQWTGNPNEALFDTIFAYQKHTSSKDVDFPWKVVEGEATVD
ncbi:hypothetical protein LTR60_007439, partial [Cryomyces antarcticus]